MGELVFFNDRARELHENRTAIKALRTTIPSGFTLKPATSSPRLSENIDGPEDKISDDRWEVVERVAGDPELVACIELEECESIHADISEVRKKTIEEVGLNGVRKAILGTFDISEIEFFVAESLCRERVIERHGLDEQTPRYY